MGRVQFLRSSGTRLFFLWILRLSLLWSQHTAASDEAVSLMCNQTVDVQAGEAVTLNCSIRIHLDSDCAGVMYKWHNTSGPVSCNDGSMKYTCGWNNQTYVSLIISDVTEQENYTVSIVTYCGLDEASVSVRVKRPDYNTNGGVESKGNNNATQNYNKWVKLLVVICFLCVVVVVFVGVLRYKKKVQNIDNKNLVNESCNNHKTGISKLMQ